MALRIDPLAPRVLLRLEGAAALVLSLLLYAALGRSWWLFVVLLLAPDVAFLGYLISREVGLRAYNAVHTLILPAALFAIGFVTGAGTTMAVALIWVAHIGLDRSLGFELKRANAKNLTAS